MFSSLRIGTPLYVLHKSEPRIEIGETASVGVPYPQFSTAYQAGMIQPQKMVVDIKLRVGEQTIDLQKMPADQSIADFGTNEGMVISESKDAILNEIEVLRKGSQAVLDSVDRHRDIVDKCDELVQMLNPAIKQEAQQRKEIDSLNKRVDSISDDVTDIKGMLTKLLNKSKKEE